MFDKKNDQDLADDSFISTGSSDLYANSGNAVHQAEPSLLSAGVFIKGSISSKGPIHFHGTVEGEVDAPQIRLGENGVLNGKIQCDDLSIDGQVDGEVRCDTLVASKTAVISGNLHCQSLRLQLGAQVNGNIRIGDPIEKK